MLCKHCRKDKPLAAKGLCRACYSRLQKNGTLEYLRKGKRQLCTVEGCARIMASRGLCQMHLNRQRRHGHTDQTRPETWGEINKHPLIEQWNYLHHRRGVELCDPAWRTDFRRFASDVGERPSPRHRLKPRDSTRLIGPDNFVWVAPEFSRHPDETPQEAANRAERARRKDRPEIYKKAVLRRKYSGLTPEALDEISRAQGGVCAICGLPETAVIRGKRISLSVDHDHATRKVRGLLCLKCNRGLGLLQDSVAVLEKAKAYLIRHGKTT